MGIRIIIVSGLMVIGDFNICRAVFRPSETDSVLPVDADTVLPLSVSGQSFESVAGRHPQFVKQCCGIQLIKFSGRNFP